MVLECPWCLLGFGSSAGSTDYVLLIVEMRLSSHHHWGFGEALITRDTHARWETQRGRYDECSSKFSLSYEPRLSNQ